MVSYNIRRYQVIMLFWALAVAFNIRSNLPCAIIAMADKNDTLTLDWTKTDIKTLVSSFQWSYFVLQIPSGWWSFKYGGKNMVLKSLLVNSVLTLITPAVIKFGNREVLCGIRFLEGLSQGVLYPSIHSILAKWLPVSERSIWGAFTYCGSVFGIIMTYTFTHVFVEIWGLSYLVLFFIPGICGILFCIVWYNYGASSPREYQGTTLIEKQYIEGSLEEFGHEEWLDDELPWKEILISAPFWALVLAHCGNIWGVWTLSQAPGFMIHAMGIEMWKQPLITASPYVATFVGALVFITLAKLCACCNLSLNTSRKFFNTIGLWTPMVLLVVMSHCQAEESFVAVALLLISAGMNAGHYLGFMINHIDLAPNFAGLLMGITNGAANLLTFFAAFLQRVIVRNEADVQKWQIIFYVTAAFYFWGNLWYILIGSAEVQNWNNPPTKYARKSIIRNTIG